MTVSAGPQIRKLNSLRGLAALVVVVAHFSGSTGWLGGYPGLGAGQLGVMLFFVLSGFLMGHLYVGRTLSAQSLYRYVVARFARVVPLFAAVVVASAVSPRVGFPDLLYSLSGRSELAAHVLLLNGTSVLWTIPTEIHFYVAFVALWFGLRRATKAQLPILFAIVGVVTALGFPRFRGEIAGIPYDIRITQVVPYFIVGVALAVLYSNYGERMRQSTWANLVLVAIPLMYPLVFEELFGFRHGLWNDPLVLVVVAGVFGVVLFVVPDDSIILANPVGDYLGKVSYSLYLLHVPIMRVVQRFELANTVAFGLFLCVSLLVATAVFVAFERPAQRWIRAHLLDEEPGTPSRRSSPAVEPR